MSAKRRTTTEVRRVALVYPPGEQKISEPIPPPNMTIAVLADALTKAGYEALQVDAEKEWFDGLRGALTARQTELLYDKEGPARYVSGRAGAKLAAEYRRLQAALLKGLRIGPVDFVAITLVDMRAEPLIINFSVLLAHALKEKYGAGTAIGYRGMPREGYFYLLRKFPCLDYGVHAHWGEKALLAILDERSGREAELTGTVARRGSRLRGYGGGELRRPLAPRPLYDPRILEKYKATAADIFSRYNPDAYFARNLSAGTGRYLVTAYAFELTCPGACAFCDNDNRLPSDRKSPDQVIDELSELKRLGATGVYFINSSFNNSYKGAEELCEKMVRAKLGLKWFDCANLRAMDERLLDKMKAAGAVKLTYGVETGSRRLMDYVNKGLTPEKASRLLRYSDRIGIWNHIELIAGFPTETDADIAATLDFVDGVKDAVDLYTLNPFYLYPNSRFFREQKRYGVKVRPYPPMQLMNFFYPIYRIVQQFSYKFDETGGLRWEEKNEQIMRSTKALADKINSIATFRAIGNEHLYLLNCLYDKLGHGRKPLIRKMVKVLTTKFKPYNLDFFMDDFRTSFSKQKDRRIFLPLSAAPYLGESREAPGGH